MKVTGPGPTTPSSKVKKTDKAKKTDSEFGDFVASGAKSAAGAGSTQSIAKVDALLALQGVEDPTARAARKRMRGRAMDLLAELERIRMAMLQGQLTVGHMIDIADVVASHRDKVVDPTLTSLLDEIDLRAHVELAKMRKAIDAQNNKT